MNSKEVVVKEVVSDARKLFKSVEFVRRKIPAELTKWDIEVSKWKCPVVSEWIYGKGECLVFNTLNSCLGLIAIKDKMLYGVHLSLYNEFDLKNKKRKERYQGLVGGVFEGGECKRSFGDSQTVEEWEDRGLETKFLEKEGFSPVKKDKNECCWIFWIEGGKTIRYESFKKK